jgi:hypothetical protein
MRSDRLPDASPTLSPTAARPRTQTAVGARFLRQQLLRPSADVSTIHARQVRRFAALASRSGRSAPLHCILSGDRHFDGREERLWDAERPMDN